MTEFNKGDRVEYRSAIDPSHTDNGRKGTIIGKGPYGPHIQYDDGSITLEYPYPENVRLIAEDSDTPAVLRAKAAEVRNLRDEKYAEIDRLRDEASTLHEEALALEQAAAILEKIK